MCTVRVIIDTKNMFLYAGGIAHWFRPLLVAWIESRRDVYFTLLGPEFRQSFLPDTVNWTHASVCWPIWLPRQLRHPWYDNVLFPRAVSRIPADMVMSPYHDVRIPANKRSVITVHDLCLGELRDSYPRRIRAYYLSTLRRNLKHAAFILTVSETSCRAIRAQYGIGPDRIGVVYNAPPDTFSGDVEEQAIAGFKSRFGLTGQLILYPGGSEYRKNVQRLAHAFELLVRENSRLSLLVTGGKDNRWDAALSGLPAAARRCINFLGRLDDTDLRLAYAAADAVVYPSLCEGFGRVCLEAMACGRPLACSDLPVMHEVAGDYPTYFDPRSIHGITAAMAKALKQGRSTPRQPVEYQLGSVCNRFVAYMDKQLEAVIKFIA